jgi:hypothetical protein
MIVVCQFLSPSVAYALTGGPTQPEVQSFAPAGSTDMVDLFSGDFSYNIPLFELPGPNGGYPFNLSYQSGIGMDQEASWVGLGWSLNPGAITRQMRGLPDEFKGDREKDIDMVKTKMSMDPSITVGLGAGISVELFGGDASLGVGFNVSHNNYKGIGYSISADLGFSGSVGNSMNGGIGLGLTLDTREGANANASLSLEGMTIGADYNSKQGLNALSLTQSGYSNVLHSEDKDHGMRQHLSSTTSLSLAHPGYTPQITMPMKNTNLSATLKLGGAWWGVFGAPYVRGFYNEQSLENNNKQIGAPAFGYLNHQYATAEDGLMDFNREKDGMVTKESPNLPIPSMTYDIYSATGQGMSAVYRPMRNDYGILRDPQTISKSVATSAGADAAPGLAHLGVNLTVNHSKSVSGQWSGEHAGDLVANTGFKDSKINEAYEPWYFKVHGEPNAARKAIANSVGGDKAVKVKLDNANAQDPSALPFLQNSSANDIPVPAVDQERKSRNQMIQAITNEQLLNGASDELLSYFKVEFVDVNVTKEFDRSSFPANHIAGFTALTAEGLRYNYAIPAYNNKQEETTFAALKNSAQVDRVNVNTTSGDPKHDYEGTDKFLKTVEIPKYAHSHLLTSIIGPDYVDVDGNGVSEKDLGYWVKFTYTRKSSEASPYKWRDPYSKAHLQEGYRSDQFDDKGSYTYGEKEIWYLTKAETKSHIANFELDARHDARGVFNRLQDTNTTGADQYSLKQIKLYSRLSPTIPIKVTKFTYDYSLCKGVDNNANAAEGKLTLKSLHFEYGNSSRGSLNPYLFSYSASNPNYDMLAYDRWGNYKPYAAGEFDHNRDFPYVDQSPSAKQQIDDNAAAWSLTQIRLPSGGTVNVDYESDDYAYVQHLPAMQMMEVVSPDGDPNVESFQLADGNVKVRFKLESPISGTLTAEQQAAEVAKYLDLDSKQLFFKYKINLRAQSENQHGEFYEYINGYVEIDPAAPMRLDNGGSGDYKYGYFSVKKEDTNRNPFSLRAWQHLRTNQPEIAYSGTKLTKADTNGDRVNRIKSVGSLGKIARQLFGGFYPYCDTKGWGRQVKSGKSWIRLYSPDKIKYGGGLRVRQITMKDSWTESASQYGQVYQYTTEENGKAISSGVAAYEPIVGGEENPLRHAKKYTQSVPLVSKNNLFFEYPANESCYPGPQVGYSKVTVMSLASANLAELTQTIENGNRVFPADVAYGTSGKTTHEFYTAKDFPVITDETKKENKHFRQSIMIPTMGSITVSKLTASQGYSIITNDMHGKPKKVSNYRQDSHGVFEPEPISWVKYNYFSDQKIYDKQKISVLKNLFKDLQDGTLAAISENETPSEQNQFTIGQETEFFYDMREFNDQTWGGGANYNDDVVIIPLLFFAFPLDVPSVWPSISESTVRLRTVVTNKMIFKSGILESTEAFDGGSLVKTENLKWDKNTGAPILTRVNNNFDAPIYAYSVPAYTQYQGMGAAYQNIGMELSISGVTKSPYSGDLYTFATPVNNLFPGDEMLLFSTDPEIKKPLCKVVYNGSENSTPILYSTVNLTATDYRALIIRSGYRNQLTVSAGSITALTDPSEKGEVKTHSKTIQIPR